MSLIVAEMVNKVFTSKDGKIRTHALSEINLSVESGEFVGIVGKSGSGKSTLINMLTGIDRPTDGKIWIDGTRIDVLSENDLSVFRGEKIGIVFQFFQLLSVLTVRENVLLPMDFLGRLSSDEKIERADQILASLNLTSVANYYPSELSVGQQQVTAIARALANDPPILIADEPTGNLDSTASEAVIDLFSRLVEAGKTILTVTHDPDIAKRTERIIRISDGKIISDSRNANAMPEDASADATEKGGSA